MNVKHSNQQFKVFCYCSVLERFEVFIVVELETYYSLDNACCSPIRKTFRYSVVL